jgi:hypothetical protein
MKPFLWMAIPACKTCIHYVPPLDGRFGSELSKCNRVNTYDEMDEKFIYSLATDVRQKECGPEGRLYEPEPKLKLKKIKHTIKQYSIYAGYILLYASLFAYTKIKFFL